MLYKRRKSRFWWCQFTAPNGKRVQKSTKTVDRKQAQEFEDRLRAELWRVIKLGDKPRKTWQEAVVRWFKESQKKTLATDRLYLTFADPFLRELYLDEITRDRLDAINQAKLATGVKPATVNRMMEVIRAILNKTLKDWEWVDRVPSVRMLKEPNKRIRWLTHEEAKRLMHRLPDHTEAMARFTLGTGLRESNVTGLKWGNVDLERRICWVDPEDSKNARPIGVALSNEVVILLRQQIGKHDKFVFTYNGRPVKKVNTKAWRNALKDVGIENFRWHDLRHTWASWLIQAGTPIEVLQEMGAWNDIRMVQRYAHLSVDHFHKFANRLCGLKVA